MPPSSSVISIFTHQCAPDLSAIRSLREILSVELSDHLAEKQIEAIQLVVSEWLTNLAEHASPMADKISIAAKRDLKANSITITVADDGEYFADFHERLQQLPDMLNVETLDMGGMGLYLMRQHFPAVRYEHEEKQNCLSFTVLLPVSEISAIATILVVEDTSPMALLIRKMLGAEYEVILAYTGQQAKDILRAQKIDLMLCDIGLPDIDGITLRKQMEQDVNLRGIPFVFLTANEKNAIEQQAYDLGVDDYLPKPVKQDKLLNTVRRILQRNQQLTHSIGEKLDAEATDRMIPRCPVEVGAYSTELLFKEASAGGGDMVLHFTRPQDEVIIIADVTGHGSKAKYFAHLYGGYLYGLLKHFNSNESPEILMAQLSDMIDADSHLVGNFITCQIISIQQGRLSICSAGHPPPLLLDKTGAKPLPIEGTMPGLLAGTAYEPHLLTLHKDEALLLYSDGLVEGSRDLQAQEQFGTWLKEQSASLCMDRLWDGYLHHFGDLLYDDVTALIIRP
ncbi:MAG: SpoIIE family protein phosphatase [Rickettsiales bacterium]|nr:SpoIIE family protein phosphatase [Rickettsiales bacterium]